MKEEVKTIRNLIVEMAACAAIYLFSFLLSRSGFHLFSALLLIGFALITYVFQYRKTNNLVDMKGLFSLAWVGGQGIACLQLSKIQTDWNVVTWIVFFLAYFGFCVGYVKKENMPAHREIVRRQKMADRLLICGSVLAVVSWLCFIFEYLAVGFIPIFSDKPHAYSYFHVSGVHYFTISCILIPAISILWYKTKEEACIRDYVLLAVGNVTAVVVPVLCVSRFQLLFAVGFAVVIYILTNRKLNWKMLFVLLLVLVPAYVGLTVARNHDVAYLNGIFEMKNSKMPIFITQPYIYVANNFENFNCLVEQIGKHTCGIRMLFPFFALTGLKFLFPQVVSTAVYITKPELTTLTMFYDAYYDFGAGGVLIFSIILGFAAKKITEKMHVCANPVMYLLYGQVAIYLGLSFFTTWFSNPTTWFWLALTAVMYVFVGFDKKKGVRADDGKN